MKEEPTKSIKLKPIPHIDRLPPRRKLFQPRPKNLRTLIHIALVIDQTRHGIHGLKPLPRVGVPLHVPFREQRKPARIRMLPSIVPVRLRELGIDAIDALDHLGRVDAVQVGRDAHHGPVPPVQRHVVMLPPALSHFVEVVESPEAGGERAGHGAQW